MKWFKENPIAVKILLFVGLAGVVFLAWKKGLFGGKSASIDNPTGDPLESEYANKLAAFMESKWGASISGVTLQYSSEERFAPGADLGGYMINGTWTKPGSIMAAFGSSVHGWAANGNPADQADWEAMSQIFYEFRNKKLKKLL